MVNRYNVVENKRFSDDNNGHDTHLAGIIESELLLPKVRKGLNTMEKNASLEYISFIKVIIKWQEQAEPYLIKQNTLYDLWGFFSFLKANGDFILFDMLITVSYTFVIKRAF